MTPYLSAVKARLDRDMRLLNANDLYGEAMAEPSWWASLKDIHALLAMLEVATAALEKIADPRKRDHKEPDKYAEVGCMINMADEALARIASLGEGGE